MTFVAAVQSSCWEGTTRDVQAVFLSLDGPVNLRSRGQLIPIRLDSRPGRGDIIETPDGSQASLSLLPNVLVQVDPSTSLEIVRLSLVKDGNETGNSLRGRFADIKLRNGRIFVSHNWGEATARFSAITSEGMVVTPSNALFVVQSEPRKTRVTCASGWVEFLPAGAATAIRIPPGFVGEWPSPGPNISAAEADPRSQEELQRAIEIEERLRNLMAQRRNILPR